MCHFAINVLQILKKTIFFFFFLLQTPVIVDGREDRVCLHPIKCGICNPIKCISKYFNLNCLLDVCGWISHILPFTYIVHLVLTIHFLLRLSKQKRITFLYFIILKSCILFSKPVSKYQFRRWAIKNNDGEDCYHKTPSIIIS